MAGILDGIGNWLTSPNTPKQQAFFRALSAAGAKGLQSTGASYALPRSSRQNYGDMLAAYQGSMQDSETRQVGLDKAERDKTLFEQQQAATQAAIARAAQVRKWGAANGLPPGMSSAAIEDVIKEQNKYRKPALKEVQLKDALARGEISKLEYDAAISRLNKPLVSITNPPALAAIEALTNRRDQYATQADAARKAGNTKLADRYQARADQLTMKIMFGGNPPETYTKAARALTTARTSISSLYNKIKGGKANPLNFQDRASVEQDYKNIVLALADLKGRGANFTDTEQAMIDGIIGGNPNDVISRNLRGDDYYLRALIVTGAAIEREAKAAVDAYSKPLSREFTYPWQGGAAPASSAAPASTLSPAAQHLLQRNRARKAP